MNHQNLLNFAIKTAKEAGSILMQHFGKISSIEQKSTDIDLVTIADTESEFFILDQIQTVYPNHHIISEESEITEGNSEYRWVIDPLDGTTNFVHNFPIFSVSIALQFNKETIIGIVYNPIYNQCFHAVVGEGAFLNKKPIKPTSTKTLSKSLLVTGFPYAHDKRWELGFDIFKDFYARNQGMRRLGAASLDLCFVAMGRMDGFYEFHLKPWDVCAGELILRESGGKTSDWDGKNPMPFSGERILASNGEIHQAMSEVLMQDKYKLFMV